MAKSRRVDVCQPGTRIRIGNLIYISKGSGPAGRLALSEEGRPARTKYFSRQQLDDRLASRAASILYHPREAAVVPSERVLTSLDAIPSKERDSTLRRYRYVLSALESSSGRLSPRTLEGLIRELAVLIDDASPPHWRTVITWVTAYRQSNSVLGLVDQRRGNTHSRLHPLVSEMLESLVETQYLVPTGPSMKELHRRLQYRIAEHNQLAGTSKQLSAPSMKAVRRYVSTLDGFDVIARRLGLAVAKRTYRASKAAPVADYPLEVVEIDSTVLDVNCTWQGIFELGRPTLTLAVDKATRAVVYVGLDFAPPSYETVASAIAGVVLGNDDLLKELGLPEKSWPMRGLPTQLRLDNGKEYRSSHLESACALLRISLTFCPPRHPWFKGTVERLIKTLNTSVLRQLPGYKPALKSRVDEAEYTQLPKFDCVDVYRIIVQWVITIYHQTPHPVLGKTPASAWEEAIAKAPSEMPFSVEQVEVALGRTLTRSLLPGGIEVDGLIYDSDELALLRRQLRHHHGHPENATLARENRERVRIRVPRQIDRVYVLNPISNSFIVANAVAKNYTKGLSRRRHALNKSWMKAVSEGELDIAALQRAHVEIDRLIKQASVHAAESRGKLLAMALESPASAARPSTSPKDHAGEDLSNRAPSASAPPADGTESSDPMTDLDALRALGEQL